MPLPPRRKSALDDCSELGTSLVIDEETKGMIADACSDESATEATDMSKDGEWTTIDPNNCQGIYGLGISAVAPRPVAVITSQDKDGIINCAPFSYTGLLSHDPPMVAHGLCISRAGKKDTLVNIEETGEWCFNVLTENWLVEANKTSAAYESDVNELEVAGLGTLSCDNVKVPRVKEARIAMECKLESKKEVFNDEGNHTTTIVFGRIVKYHIHTSVLGGTQDRPVVDLEKAKLCGRVGNVTYWPAGEGKAVPIERP
jgi:flavin reductase (DIM6/NTAB) family NADH-FMN oxidoreductase RutF